MEAAAHTVISTTADATTAQEQESYGPVKLLSITIISNHSTFRMEGCDVFWLKKKMKPYSS